MPRLDAVTRSDLAYLRVHGRDAERYLRGRSAAERFDYAYDDTSCTTSRNAPARSPRTPSA